MSHLAVMEQIQGYIRERQYKAGARLPSGRDLQYRLKVGRMTIDRALACLVAQGVLRREGYKVFVNGPVDLPENRPLCHLLAVAGGDRPLGMLDFPGLLRGASEVAAANNMRLLPIFGPDQVMEIRRLLSDGSSGFVVWAERRMADVLPAPLRQAVERNVPFVVCDIDLGPFDFVGTDNERGMEAGVKHLLGLGHRRLAYITDTARNSSIECRLSGYQQACLRYKLGRSYQRVFAAADGDRGAIDQALRLWAAEKNRATGVLFSNLALAALFRDACHAAGLRVPEDVSLVGFDAEPAGETFFTTLAQDMYQIGVVAVQRLRQALREKQLSRETHIVRIRLEPTLVIGRSTAAPPGRD